MTGRSSGMGGGAGAGQVRQRPRPQAERSDGPPPRPSVAMARMATSPVPLPRSAVPWAAQGHLALQLLTHRACLSGVSAANAASCTMQPMARAPQVAWSAAEGQGHRGRLLLLTFLGRLPRKGSRGVGMKSPPRDVDQTQLSIENTAFAHAPGAGMCPRQGSHFLLFRQEKVTKEKATPVPPTLRWRSGQPAVLAAWAHRATRFVHCVHSVQTGTMSQMLKREVPRAAQATALLGVGTGAPGAGTRSGPSLRSATPFHARAQRSAHNTAGH